MSTVDFVSEVAATSSAPIAQPRRISIRQLQRNIVSRTDGSTFRILSQHGVRFAEIRLSAEFGRAVGSPHRDGVADNYFLIPENYFEGWENLGAVRSEEKLMKALNAPLSGINVITCARVCARLCSYMRQNIPGDHVLIINFAWRILNSEFYDLISDLGERHMIFECALLCILEGYTPRE